MQLLRKFNRIGSFCLVSTLFVGFFICLSPRNISAQSAPSYSSLRKLHGHLPAAAARLTPIGGLPASQRLDLAITLPLHNPEGLDQLLREIYDPASPNYHRYLTPEQFSKK